MRECRAYNKTAHILVIDDGSTDKTGEKVKEFKDKNTTLFRQKNKGYGGALITGYDKAKTKYISFLDADLTYHPKYLAQLLKLVKEKSLDCAWGNRFGGKNQMPKIRQVGNQILVSMFHVITGRYVPDVSCGERVFTKEALEKIDFRTLPTGLDMITAMTKRIVKRKLKYRIIPIDYAQREGASKLNLVKDFLRMSRNIIRER